MNRLVPEVNEVKQVQVKPASRIRWWLAFLFFVIGLIAYMDRSNISIIAKPMMEDLNMDKVQFGFLASIFSLGYALAQVPAGILAERFGARRIVFLALVWWSVFTGLTAIVKSHGLLALVRFLFGVGEGPMYPGNAVFNTYWFQKEEKGRAASALLAGSYFGPVIAPILTVAIFQAWGWQAVFYIFGLIGIFVAFIWYLIGRDKPEEHPMVSKEELELIVKNRTVKEEKKEIAPWGQFLKNGRFWALGLQYCVVLYIVTFFLVWLPTYLMEARSFSLQNMGFAASLPWLCIFITVMTGGTISDWLVKKGKSKMVARGSLAIGGLVIFAVTMYLAAYVTIPWMNVLWLTLALGSLGFPVVTSWAAAVDLGNEYSGSVSGWMNLWGNIGAFLSPILCGWLAETIGWEGTLLISIVPILFAIGLWFVVRPDRSFT
ncbi:MULTISPECIES: MFS transporter [Aneurinibacillus]|uniref:MFS transporter n=1 Tax=Aneurinibacillus thermoaerophilus TaxID=143495 RepID=A0A1G8EBQ9_ANETH|nr:MULTISPECIES: MFS transporter [Aneurinibacillus]AMA72406.1 glucarate transporter [Aneurinibacillus sp. XH2]MED0676353.1 MFS transporter [Aneurinibacillus thermoaerophilus]MED0737882.1 MFS transporter [Aneurinibacillus thermoaerophilus]MED0759163.1 MFS transporter [Aneurinibacillus thermoaerophilus]MED0762698.1 MFS transporter [Aneurinibacillus thermoaerophilus]